MPSRAVSHWKTSMFETKRACWRPPARAVRREANFCSCGMQLSLTGACDRRPAFYPSRRTVPESGPASSACAGAAVNTAAAASAVEASGAILRGRQGCTGRTFFDTNRAAPGGQQGRPDQSVRRALGRSGSVQRRVPRSAIAVLKTAVEGAACRPAHCGD
jgi:hypothetical protein